MCAVRGSRPVPKGRLAGLRVLEPHGPLRILPPGAKTRSGFRDPAAP